MNKRRFIRRNISQEVVITTNNQKIKGIILDYSPYGAFIEIDPEISNRYLRISNTRIELFVRWSGYSTKHKAYGIGCEYIMAFDTAIKENKRYGVV